MTGALVCGSKPTEAFCKCTPVIMVRKGPRTCVGVIGSVGVMGVVLVTGCVAVTGKPVVRTCVEVIEVCAVGDRMGEAAGVNPGAVVPVTEGVLVMGRLVVMRPVVETIAPSAKG